MMFKKFNPRGASSGQPGFTLVELLVALAVLSILVTILAQVIALTSQAIDINTRKLDAAGEARLFFDRLGADMAAMPQRTDLGMTLYKANGNDTIQLYTTTPGYGAAPTSGRQISWVTYSIGLPPSGTGPNCLIREADGMDWTPGNGTTAVSFLQPPSFTPLAAPTAAITANSDVLANGIFRLEFCYLLTTTGKSGTFTNALGPTDQYSAIVVAVAVLDHKSLGLLTSSQVNNNLPALFADAAASSDLLSTWSAAMAVPGFGGGSGIPPKVIQEIRIYQRTFYVP
jgi:prepilin-type N-terminal cleavage/methylation domain-containing protein